MAGDQFITPAVAKEMLYRVYRSDEEVSLDAVLRRVISDPIKPVTETGRMRPSTALVAMCGTLILIAAVFLYFSFRGRV